MRHVPVAEGVSHVDHIWELRHDFARTRILGGVHNEGLHGRDSLILEMQQTLAHTVGAIEGNDYDGNGGGATAQTAPSLEEDGRSFSMGAAEVTASASRPRSRR